jgi:hypothetical protein
LRHGPVERRALARPSLEGVAKGGAAKAVGSRSAEELSGALQIGAVGYVAIAALIAAIGGLASEVSWPMLIVFVIYATIAGKPIRMPMISVISATANAGKKPECIAAMPTSSSWMKAAKAVFRPLTRLGPWNNKRQISRPLTAGPGPGRPL